MDFLCVIVFGFVFFITILVLFIFAVVQKRKRRNAKNKEERAFRGIVEGISERLHTAYPCSKWRWVCRPAGFALSGGIARIEVLYPSGNQCFMDVCFSINNYMSLHVLNVVELTASDTVTTMPNQESSESGLNIPAPTAPKVGIKPNDEESVEKWYNIVLIDALTTLIDNLNATGEACLYIGQNGKAFIEENGNNTVVCEFGEMPDVGLWGHITERLGGAGLFAEIQEKNCIFISWA